ncbi:MAG TPA: esterase [Eoetvoesiella sp.]
MTITQQGKSPPPLIFLPMHSKPKQLFVLLHGDSAAPEQLMSLTQALRQAFPEALLVLPYGTISSDASAYHWFEQSGLNEANYADRVARALPGLVTEIQQLQAVYGLSGENTALAGFDQGATMALEACSLHTDLAGRVLAFSGSYASLPAAAPPATTLHLFHGASDVLVPLSFMRRTHEHLAGLHGDATLDIASKIGHELHDALIGQAIYRLQTCVPLRSWRAALGELSIDVYDPGLEDPDMTPNRTLH